VPFHERSASREAKAPNFKLQAPEKLQAPNIKGSSWSLVFGASLVLGAWDLELSS
jgi:hypothetical protein